jgi:WD40 repeat protein
MAHVFATEDRILCAAASPDGAWIAAGSSEGRVRLWDIKTKRLHANWHSHTALGADAMRKNLLGDVMMMAFSADSKKLLTVSVDPVGYLIDAQGKNKRRISPFTPVRIWDVATGKELGLQDPGESSIRWAGFSPDGRRVLTLRAPRQIAHLFSDKTHKLTGRGNSYEEKERTARVWDSVSGAELFALQGNWLKIGMAEWNPDGTRIVTTHDDAVRIWNAADGKELTKMGQGHLITSVLWSPDGQRLVTWEDESVNRNWPLLDPVPGKKNRWTTKKRQADLWDAVTGKHVATLTGHQVPISFIAFSPDGKRLVTTAEQADQRGSVGMIERNEDTNFRDRTARVWDAHTGKLLHVLRGHLRSVHSAGFSKDGKLIVTTSDDRTARIWDLSTGKEFFTLTGHREGVKSAEFTPDGQFVVTSSWDGAVRLWPTDPLALAMERKPRELTAEERDRFDVDRANK